MSTGPSPRSTRGPGYEATLSNTVDDLFWPQVTIMLKNMLKRLDIEVNVRTFEEEDGIEGLAGDSFVSFKFQIKHAGSLQERSPTIITKC